MRVGYVVIDNQIYCPYCAEKHPRVQEMRRRIAMEEKMNEIIAEALWKLSVGDKEEYKGVKKQDFINYIKARRRVL